MGDHAFVLRGAEGEEARHSDRGRAAGPAPLVRSRELFQHGSLEDFQRGGSVGIEERVSAAPSDQQAGQAKVRPRRQALRSTVMRRVSIPGGRRASRFSIVSQWCSPWKLRMRTRSPRG